MTFYRIKTGCHGEPVEPWWVGLSARVFNRLRLTGLFYTAYIRSHPELDPTGDAHHNHWRPFRSLFELYMQAISNGHNGQYFTPTPICEMMAIMNIGNNSQSGQTVCEPTCGSEGNTTN
jgi:hypothetical protein